MQHRTQVPVAQAVAEEKEVALAEAPEELDWDETLEVSSREVLDVVVLGDDVAILGVLGIGLAAVDEAVKLQDHRPLGRIQRDVRLRLFDQPPRFTVRPMPELSRILA